MRGRKIVKQAVYQEMSKDQNKPRNHLIVDASTPFTFKYRQYGDLKSVTVNQRPDEDTWPGGALWDIGVLLAKLLVMAATPSVPVASKQMLRQEDIVNVPRARSPGIWPISWKDCTILELGCGVGLTGLVGALLGAKLTILTDLDIVVEKVTKPNVELNKKSFSKSQKVIAATLSWGDEENEMQIRRLLEETKLICPLSTTPKAIRPKKKIHHKGSVKSDMAQMMIETSDPSIILIGDVAYQHKPGAPSHFDRLMSTLLLFATTRNTLVLFGTRMRMPASADLLEMFREHFDELIEPVEADEIDPSFSSVNLGRQSLITLHVFKRKINE